MLPEKSMKAEIEKLKENIIEQAKYFLSEAGEFYPFGSVIKADGSISPQGAYMGDNDHPESLEVIKVLEDGLIHQLKMKEALAVAIGVDVLHKKEREGERTDAIQIRVLTADGESVDYFLHYKNNEGEFIYEDKFFSEEGTLRLE